MSTLQYTSPAGHGQHHLKKYGYSQVVRVGDVIHISGQGGWVYETGEMREDTEDQIDQAFANVDHILREAGGKGWDQVYKVNSYHVALDDRALEAMTRNLGKWMKKHKPLWTCVGVAKLGGGDAMKVEIEVQAFDKGA
ncbi:hypothetical protein KVR01_009486 [Diaporthe batatas]|uniref:uncharacterized protein n=1 Tax=Diaporthe batatas TaxID=748121 RepID=UPI001D04EAB2|nr:uncharacterized protein KVR01_009486 [Diaporthe batatas]KAG8161222.1 hypothetical protein KVR01_009486 [Diaporthe batatas]